MNSPIDGLCRSISDGGTMVCEREFAHGGRHQCGSTYWGGKEPPQSPMQDSYPQVVSERWELWFWHIDKGATWRLYAEFSTPEQAQEAATALPLKWPNTQTKVYKLVKTREAVDE